MHESMVPRIKTQKQKNAFFASAAAAARNHLGPAVSTVTKTHSFWSPLLFNFYHHLSVSVTARQGDLGPHLHLQEKA